MKILDSPYGRAPRHHPRLYPGVIPDFSFVFTGETIERLTFDAANGWCLLTDDTSTTLDNWLHQHDAAPLDARYPIVACGSNACPGQLWLKFEKPYHNKILPVMQAIVTGLDAVYSGHLSSYGAVPATMTTSPGTTVKLHILLADDEQFDTITRSEGVNYDLCRIDGSRYSLVLENGSHLREYYGYVSLHGMLLVDEQPVRLESIAASDTHFTAMPENEVLLRVLAAWNAQCPEQPLHSINALHDRLLDGGITSAQVTRVIKQAIGQQDSTLIVSPPDVRQPFE